MGFRKAEAYNMQEVLDALKGIKDQKLRVYGAITLYLAARSGEIMPYRHYHYEYERNDEGKVMKTKSQDGSTKYASKRKVISSYDSPGIEVSSILILEDYIKFKVPVFKCKELVYDSAFIFKKNNPFFDEIKEYIIARKILKEQVNKPVYLFQAPGDVEKFFYSFKRRFARAFKKQLPGAKVHSLRKSMATYAAVISGGDVFFVKGVTRHRKLETLTEYVAPVKLEKQFRSYLEGSVL